MKDFLRSDWGPALRQVAQFVAIGVALAWVTWTIARDGLVLISGLMAGGEAPGVEQPVMVAAPVAPPPAPSKGPRPKGPRSVHGKGVKVAGVVG